jgi:DNA-binding response OmpR family regulator
MKSKSKLALIVSSDESSLNGLLALLTTLPQIGTVLVAEDQNLALRMIGNHYPALVILDMSLPDALDLIKQIRAHWARVGLIVLAKDGAQAQEAEAAGADDVLVRGFSAQKLITLAENLIDLKGGDSSVDTDLEGGTKDEMA